MAKCLFKQNQLILLTVARTFAYALHVTTFMFVGDFVYFFYQPNCFLVLEWLDLLY